MPYVPVAELKDYIGKELGRSEWLTIDQERINLFAEATGDYSSSTSTRSRPRKRPLAAPLPTAFCRCR
jgi:hypothetical protein